jgi:hypothetical protein
VGYNETSKAYRIYIPVQQKILVRRDVRFEEERAFRKSLDLRDKDSHAPQIEQDTAPGARTQVTGAPSTGTTGSPGSGVTQVTGTGVPGTGVVHVHRSQGQVLLGSVVQVQGH